MLTPRVDPSLLRGVELPPVPAQAGPPVPAHAGPEVRSGPARGDFGADAERPRVGLSAWWAMSRRAASLGAGIVWFQSAADGTEASCDPCAIAAAAIDHVPDVHLGVVSSVPSERHPAVLAREVTALDVVSRGRAAVRLRTGSFARSVPLSEVGEQFAEAVAVCGAVLRDEIPVFEGRHYHVAGAVNRPPPVQPGGLALFAGLPAGPAGVTPAAITGGSGTARMMLRAASAVVCSDDPADVAAWRAAIEEATLSTQAARKVLEPPALVCETVMREPVDAPDHAVADTGGIAVRLRAARDAGADGVIVRILLSRHVEMAHRYLGSAVPEALVPSGLERALAVRFAPWVS